VEQFLLKKEGYSIVGAAITVYNDLGPGFLEAVYQNALEIELGMLSIPFVSQKPFSVYFHGHLLKHDYI